MKAQFGFKKTIYFKNKIRHVYLINILAKERKRSTSVDEKKYMQSARIVGLENDSNT